MEDFPHSVAAYLSSQMIGKRAAAYLILDQHGIVRDSGGNLDRFGVDLTGSGWDVTDRLLFMVGLLPMESPFLKLYTIKLNRDIAIDAHIFKIDTGYGLLLLDAGENEMRKKKIQQRANEMMLLRGKKKSAMNEIHLEDILGALNVLAVERSSNGSFAPFGTPPQWMDKFAATLGKNNDGSDAEDDFSFLGNFLTEATEFWNKKKAGCVRSDIWVEGDASGNKYMFEAIALTSLDKQILIIARNQKFYEDKQLLLQKGRQLALDYQALAKLEESLQRARSELEMRVKARTEDLELSNRRIAEELKERKQLEEERARMERQLLHAQKMEAIGTLAGGIAHDFNNILSAILGFTELSLIHPDLDPELKENLEKVLNASFRAKDLVRQILTFSRETREEPKPLLLKPVVAEALDFIRASFPTTIEIRRELKSNGTIFANPSQIHQLIMNLCTNAGHAMEGDGGILSVTLSDVEINSMEEKETPVLPSGAYIKLSIEDTGCGMAADTINKIYDPFFTTRKNGKGTGLGLSVVHGIVKSNKGVVTVDSKPGEGSIFHVFLPKYEIHTDHAKPQKTALPHGGERILLVDDDPLQTDIAVQQLKVLGYSVTTFTDSTRALRYFMKQPHSVDIVITDQSMPGLPGTVLAEEMLRIRPELPVILCTGFGDALLEEKIHAMGVRGYLMKPLSIRDLATAIRRCLEPSGESPGS